MKYKYFELSIASFLYIFVCAPVHMYNYDFTGRHNRLTLTSQKTVSLLITKISLWFFSKSLDKIAIVVTLPGVEKIILEELASQDLGSGSIVL